MQYYRDILMPFADEFSRRDDGKALSIQGAHSSRFYGALKAFYPRESAFESPLSVDKSTPFGLN